MNRGVRLKTLREAWLVTAILAVAIGAAEGLIAGVPSSLLRGSGTEVGAGHQRCEPTTRRRRKRDEPRRTP